MALIGVSFAALTPSFTFASGSVGAPPAAVSNRAMDRAIIGKIQANTPDPSQAVIAEEPYNLGKALFSGKYKLGQPKLTAANIAEKMQRLVTLQKTLPAPEREKIKPAELSKRLTNQEMNALEYYIGMRFGKFIARSPSWAKAEPPPKIVLAK